MSHAGDARALATAVRRRVLRMVHKASASHVGSCFSMADILAVLYGGWLNVRSDRPDWPDRDRLIVSKGHAAAAVYATLAEAGFFPADWLERFCQDGQPLAGHVTAHGVPGVEFSTGSLGHGLSVGCGLALGARMQGADWRTVVVLSDGELDEGSVWEAALFAGHHRLGRLVAVIDHNKIQSFGSIEEVLDLAPLSGKFGSMGWEAVEIDGHDHGAIAAALGSARAAKERPLVIIAHTVKGKGVSFMEHQLVWHYRSPRDAELVAALAELDETACATPSDQ